jgi:hypothetical protein
MPVATRRSHHAGKRHSSPGGRVGVSRDVLLAPYRYGVLLNTCVVSRRMRAVVAGLLVGAWGSGCG